MRWMLPLLFLVLACKKSDPASGPCENGKRICKDKTTSLYCANAQWQTDTCRGARGCYEEGAAVACDMTANLDGDPCPAVMDGFGACRTDRKSRAICKSGKYVIEKCTGAEGCTMTGAGMTECDRGSPTLGDACTREKLQACDPTGKSAVVCKEGKFALLQNCPGPNGCKSQGGGLVSCDPNGAFALGDACHFIAGVCAGDRKSLLRCANAKLVLDKECPGEGGCDGVDCDTGSWNSGDVCHGAQHACGDGGKSLLKCKEGAFVLEKACKGGCTAKDGKIECT